MKVELTKREIEVIIDLMAAGSTFLTTHGQSLQSKREISGTLELVDINELTTKLESYLKEKKWSAIKINKATGIEIKIGDFIDRKNALNAISVARGIDLKDKKAYFEYLIESRF